MIFSTLFRAVQSAGSTALWIFILLIGATTITQAAKPNVVIFFTDDQGTLDANCYGSKDLYTPNMDRLAAEGVRFTQAYSHIVCCPARALLMTGRHPQRSGIVHWTQGNRKQPSGINLPKEEVTLAEALKAGGYHTALFGKWHLGARDGHGPIDQGFDRFYGHLGGFIDNYCHFFLHGLGFHDLYDGKTEIFKRDAYFPDLMTQQAVEYIEEQAKQEAPFFMYVAFNIPHYPEQADAQFEARYQDLPMPRRSYARMISTTDDRMGRVLDALDKAKLRDNTIVLFMSDNGHSGEDGAKIRKGHKSGLPEGQYYHAHGGGGNTGAWRGQKGQYYEGGIRVPAIVAYPAKLPSGAVRDQAITAADWFPTILAWCGVDLPDVTLDGRSLASVIKDPAAQSPHKTLHWAWHLGWAVREGNWKLIGNRDKPNFLGKLDDEMPEQKNYLKEKPELAARLHQLHKDWLVKTK